MAFDGRERPWVKGYLDVAEQDVADLGLPDWFRVAQLGLTRTQANGHAGFQRGELADLLGIISNNIGREITDAVKFKFLLPGSSTQCLILNQVRYNTAGLRNRGRADDECAFHAKKIARQVERMISKAQAQHHHRVMVTPSRPDGVELAELR